MGRSHRLTLRLLQSGWREAIDKYRQVPATISVPRNEPVVIAQSKMSITNLKANVAFHESSEEILKDADAMSIAKSARIVALFNSALT